MERKPWSEMDAKERRARRIGVVGFLLLAGLGVYMLAVSCKWWIQWRTVQNWTPVPAIVTKLEFSRRTEREVGDNSRPLLRINCAYTYQFDGRMYEGTRATVFEDTLTDDDFSEAALERDCREGGTWTIRVNPKAPQEAVLLAAKDARVGSWPLPGAAFLLSGLMFAYLTGAGYLEFGRN